MSNEKTAKKAKKPNIFFRLLALLVTAVLILGALILVIHRDRLNLDALERWITQRRVETGETGQAQPFTHAGGSQLSVAYLKNGILLSSSSGAHYYSFSGEKYAEEILTMEHPVLSASDNAGVVYDAGGQSLFLFRGTEEVFDLTLKGDADLLAARVNDSGWLAVTAQESGYKGAVTVYNPQGEKVIQISLSSTFAVDAILSPDCKTVAVVTIDQEAGAFRSDILFYPVNKTEPSSSIHLGSCVTLDLDYESDRLWVLGEDRLLTVDPDSNQVQSYLFGRSYLKGCNFGGNGFALLLLGRYRAGTANQAVTIGPDAVPMGSLSLSSQILSFDSAGSYCGLLSGSRLDLYDPNLVLTNSLAATQGARYTSMQDDGSALLADAQQAWLYIPD